MQKHLINNGSDRLILFFTGWGCDEYEFAHLKASSDVLLLYNYSDLELDFDFSKYKKIDLIAFSAGVFIASIMKLDFETRKRIAISGNPFMFDEKFGISKDTQKVLCSITSENADDFAKNYLIKTDTEWAKFHHSKRPFSSTMAEFESLKQLYQTHKQKINDIFDVAIAGEDDPIFNVSAQKEFYGNRLKVIENARHNLFFRIESYEEIVSFA
jgi:biotin synthesis protein BioG